MSRPSILLAGEHELRAPILRPRGLVVARIEGKLLAVADSSDVDGAGQQALNANAEIMKKYSTWVITIEGHADERGTAEYNLALGERRAMSARTYLVSLGISADRLRTVSYGKEFPFDPGHDEAAWAKNRRAQFVLTSK